MITYLKNTTALRSTTLKLTRKQRWDGYNLSDINWLTEDDLKGLKVYKNNQGVLFFKGLGIEYQFSN